MEFKIASRKALAAEINGREAEGVPRPAPPLLFPFPEVILSCCIFPPVIHLHRRQLGPLFAARGASELQLQAKYSGWQLQDTPRV